MQARRAFSHLVGALAGVTLAATGGGVRPPPDDNLLENASFEDGRAAWWCFHERSPGVWGDFQIAGDAAHAGERCARLVLDSGEGDGPTRIHGVVQEVSPGRCPEYLSGWYRVEDWERGARKQYLQVVVIVWNPGEMPRGLRANNYQLALTLAGVDEAPLPRVRNREFVVTGPAQPAEGEWVFFELALGEAFEKAWGMRPEDFESLRVLFEARCDERAAGDRARATVLYDDLYLGDRSRAEE